MDDKKILLFIVPLPPPVTGQSIISRDVYDHIKVKHEVVVLNYQRPSLAGSTIFDVRQMIKIFKFIKIIRKYRDRAQLVYMNMSVSILGNLKDIFVLFMLGKLRKKTIVHLHRDGFIKCISRYFFIRLLNRFVLKDLFKGIVLGESLKYNLSDIIDGKKVTVINNYYEPDILIGDNELNKKWDMTGDRAGKFNFLFLSNMIFEKGYLDLLYGFLKLDENIRKRCVLFFAGTFDSIKNRKSFLEKIKGENNIRYIENVAGFEKKELLNKSHAFFLPSTIPEGQPLSILEAYASGSVVFTTDTGGIKDIFTDNANGKYINGKYDDSVASLITDLIDNVKKYKTMAFYNRRYSQNFTKDKFLEKITGLFDELLING